MESPGTSRSGQACRELAAEELPPLVAMYGDAAVRGGFDDTVAVCDEAEWSRGNNLGIALLERAGGEVARVLKRFFAGFFTLLVDLQEVSVVDEDLAAHFKDVWRVTGKRQRDSADGADVVGDVIAFGSVAASQGLNEFPVLIAQAAGDAVDLGLADEANGVVEVIGDTFEPGVEVFAVVGVVDGIHALGMFDGFEAVDGLAAHALGGGVIGDEIRMLGFELLKFLEQFVIFTVGDRRLGVDVVAAIVLFELLGEFPDARFG